MKILHRESLVLGTILLLTFGLCHAARFKRQADDENEEVNDLDVSQLKIEVIRVPFFGPFLVNTMKYVDQSFLSSSGLLNTVIARIIGGSMPCEMDIGEGFKCSNGSMENDILNVLEKLAVGNTKLPVPIKYIIRKVIKDTIEPLVERFFNGRARANTNVDS